MKSTDISAWLPTDDLLDQMVSRMVCASPGPWYNDYHPGGICGQKHYRDAIITGDRTIVVARPNSAYRQDQNQEFRDADFIAHSRADMVTLVAAITSVKRIIRGAK